MNKGITLLILFVVLGAMGLVMYSHGQGGKSASPRPSVPLASAPAADGATQRNGYASPLQAPQGGGGLRPIEPPIGASASADGAPKAVTLTAGSDPRTVRPVVPQKAEDPAPPAKPEPKPADTPRQSQTGGQTSGQTIGQTTNQTGVKPGAQAQTAERPAQAKPQEPAAQSGPSAQAKPESAAGAPASDGKTASAPGDSGRSGMPGLTAGPTPWDAPKPQGTGQTQSGQTQSGQTQSGASQGAVTASLTPPANPHQPPVTDPIVNEKSLSKTGTHSLRTIHLGFAGQQMQLRIEAGDPFPVKAFALTNPDRLVVDLPGTWKDMKAPNVPENSIVSKIRLGQQPGGPRLVLDLKGPLKNHAIERAGNRVDVLVR